MDTEITNAPYERTEREFDKMKMQENLPMAILSGFIVAVLTAVLWGAITVITHFQIGFMAIGVGIAVGFTVRKFGKGETYTFGFTGAGLSLLGCLLGNLFSIAGFLSVELGISVVEMLSIIFSMPSYIPSLLIDNFHVIDILFYGLALYYGYKYSINAESLTARRKETKEMS